MSNIFSTESILNELAIISRSSTDITDFLDEANELLLSLKIKDKYILNYLV